MTDTLAKLNLPGSSITLLPATREDLPAIVDLLIKTRLAVLAKQPAKRATSDHMRRHLRRSTAIRHSCPSSQPTAWKWSRPYSCRSSQAWRVVGHFERRSKPVRVAANHRSRSLGVAMFQWAIDEARRRGCALVQPTTDKSRADAHRFYERLGFTASHEGFKLQL